MPEFAGICTIFISLFSNRSSSRNSKSRPFQRKYPHGQHLTVSSWRQHLADSTGPAQQGRALAHAALRFHTRPQTGPVPCSLSPGGTSSARRRRPSVASRVANASSMSVSCGTRSRSRGAVEKNAEEVYVNSNFLKLFLTLEKFNIICWQTLRGPFSAVSKPIFASTKY